MEEIDITLAEARSLLELHFGIGKVPAKHSGLTEWWARLLADPDPPRSALLACRRDLDEVIGPVVGRPVRWKMQK